MIGLDDRPVGIRQVVSIKSKTRCAAGLCLWMVCVVIVLWMYDEGRMQWGVVIPIERCAHRPYRTRSTGIIEKCLYGHWRKGYASFAYIYERGTGTNGGIVLIDASTCKECRCAAARPCKWWCIKAYPLGCGRHLSNGSTVTGTAAIVSEEDNVNIARAIIEHIDGGYLGPGHGS